MTYGLCLVGLSVFQASLMSTWRHDRLRTFGLYVAGFTGGVGLTIVGDAMFDLFLG